MKGNGLTCYMEIDTFSFNISVPFVTLSVNVTQNDNFCANVVCVCVCVCVRALSSCCEILIVS